MHAAIFGMLVTYFVRPIDAAAPQLRTPALITSGASLAPTNAVKVSKLLVQHLAAELLS